MKKFLVASAVAMATALSAPSYAADKPTIPVIVKDTTSGYWQIVFAGARQAAKDLNVNVPELGAQSEADINGEITILENAVAEKPAAVVIAPTQFKALGAADRRGGEESADHRHRFRGGLEGLHIVPDHGQRGGRPHRGRRHGCGDQS